MSKEIKLQKLERFNNDFIELAKELVEDATKKGDSVLVESYKKDLEILEKCNLESLLEYV